VAMASTVAEPVVWVSHQTSANCTSWLPSNENACPVQMVKKGACHLALCCCSCFKVLSPDEMVVAGYEYSEFPLKHKSVLLRR
jgi:hypothetical protein